MSQNIISLSVSAVLLASIAGCAAPVSDGSDEATVASSNIQPDAVKAAKVKSAVVTEDAGPALTATLEFSDAGKAIDTYPASPMSVFDFGTSTDVYVWAYMGNVTPGIHIVWAKVSDPLGNLTKTLPMAFSTSSSDVGTVVSPTGWGASLTVSLALPATMGPIVGYETHGHFAFSALAPTGEFVPAAGTYTVNLIENDTADPAVTDPAAGTDTLTVVVPAAT